MANREEAQAIVAYLRYRRHSEPFDIDKKQIEAALNLFWLERTKKAPPAESLRQHLIEEEEYLAAISADYAEYYQ